MIRLPTFDVTDQQQLSPPQRRVLSAIAAKVEAAACGALLVTGSLVTEEVDHYSDLDLIAISTPPAACSGVIVAAIESCGAVLATYTTDHLAEHRSSVYYVEVESALVKLDVVYRDGSKPFDIPARSAVLVGQLSALTYAQAKGNVGVPQKDLEILATKLGTWMWFTYARAARGEYFAAARSLDFSREVALLPLILDRLQLPQDGHRRLEKRLSGEIYGALESTHPAHLSFSCIFAALSAMYSLFQSELARSSLSRKAEIATFVERIWDVVRRDKLLRGL